MLTQCERPPGRAEELVRGRTIQSGDETLPKDNWEERMVMMENGRRCKKMGAGLPASDSRGGAHSEQGFRVGTRPHGARSISTDLPETATTRSMAQDIFSKSHSQSMASKSRLYH